MTEPTRTLSEPDSKALLAEFGIPFAPEHRVGTATGAVEAAGSIDGAVVVKLAGDGIAHKTERGLVRLDLSDAESVARAADELLAAARPEDGDVELLVAPMLSGQRELIAGLHLDPQFGMTVLLGIGGVFAEAIADVAIRLAPLSRADALDMFYDLRTRALLGAFRGEGVVNVSRTANVLTALSRVHESHPEIVSVDLNPLIVVDTDPIAVDALVEVRA